MSPRSQVSLLLLLPHLPHLPKADHLDSLLPLGSPRKPGPLGHLGLLTLRISCQLIIILLVVVDRFGSWNLQLSCIISSTFLILDR